MDSDKDNPLPEKSPGLEDDTDTKDIDEEKTEDAVDPDPKNDETDAGIADDDTAKTEINEPQEEEEHEKEEVKEEDPAEDDQVNTKEEEKEEQEESPPLPPNLEQLSGEIDQYILTLSTSTPKVEEDDVDINTKADADVDIDSKADADADDITKVDVDADAEADVVADTKEDADADVDADVNTESTPPIEVVPQFVQQFTNLVEEKIEGYDSKANPTKWSHLTDEDSTSFLESISRLSSLSNALSRFSSDKRYLDSINLVGRILQRALSYMEEEFKSLLEDYKINDPEPTNPEQDPPTTESEVEPAPPEEPDFFPGYSEEILSNLIRLSKAMIDGGHESECRQAYFVARRNALEDSLQKLGFEKHSIDEVQRMPWESLEKSIATWISTFKRISAVHFPKEKTLSDSVFFGSPRYISEHLSQGVLIQILNFAGAAALTKRGAEKLFKFLDVYEALRDVVPTIEDLFSEELMNDIRTEASRIKCRLGETMTLIFTELENSIKGDASKTPVPGGAVHPLARYIMNYLKLACEYRETLEQVFREHHKIERSDSTSGSDFNYNSGNSQAAEAVKHSPFHGQMVKVMDLLDANLDGKSKLYKDHALSSIFMMNNGRYILQKVKGSNEIISLMGDAWCRHRSTELRQYHKGYQRETWGKLLHCLHPEGLTVHGKVSKPVLKERFKSFNTMFDEIHKSQSTWVVSDEQLQSELRISIANMVIPAYRSFLGRYSQTFTPGRQTEKYVKYQAEDIETYIDELFDGSAAPAGRKWT